jgi:RES domain-containing protein
MPPNRPAMIAYSGVVYRATTYDVPLWVSPNRRDGRWNLAGDGCTQYFCLDAEAPYAEMLRGEDLQTEAEAKTFRTIVWQLRVDEGAIVDYTTFEKAEASGFDPAALVDDDHERCQVEAQRLKSLGAQGVLAPSAALPGSVNLTLFGARAPIAWTTTVKLASSIPVQRLTEGSAPPGLVTKVRFYGQPHVALVAYQARR